MVIAYEGSRLDCCPWPSKSINALHANVLAECKRSARCNTIRCSLPQITRKLQKPWLADCIWRKVRRTCMGKQDIWERYIGYIEPPKENTHTFDCGHPLHCVSHLFSCLFAKCSAAYLIASPLGDVMAWQASGDFLSMCPIHLLFFFIPLAMCSCFVHFHSVVLVVLSDHFRCRILDRHLLMNVCIVLVSSVYFATYPIHRITLPWHFNSLVISMIFLAFICWHAKHGPYPSPLFSLFHFLCVAVWFISSHRVTLPCHFNSLVISMICLAFSFFSTWWLFFLLSVSLVWYLLLCLQYFSDIKIRWFKPADFGGAHYRPRRWNVALQNSWIFTKRPQSQSNYMN